MLLNTKEDWQPEEKDVIAWQRAFPAVNVHQELMAMESWCDANPAKRKTKQGIKGFVNRWLTKAQDKSGSPHANKITKSDSIRSKSIDMQLADVTFLEGDKRLMMQQYYLSKFGYYYDGELKNA